MTFDYAQMGKGPEISDTVAQAGLNGTFFDANHVSKWSPGPATFALHDPAGKMAQAYLTQYAINTALESGFTTQNTLDITYLL